MHHFIRVSTWVTICLLFAQCRSVHNEPQYPVDVLPQAPQYSDPSQWYITSRNAVADVFYITSTIAENLAQSQKKHNFAKGNNLNYLM